MCNKSVLQFFLNQGRPDDFTSKRVLEVGARNVNGGVRPLVSRYCKPREYVGVDIVAGVGVDAVLPAERLCEVFGAESFDTVVSTEMLEHVVDWRATVRAIKGVVKVGGSVYITTRSRGFPFHAHPYDMWRCEIDDLTRIFSDFRTRCLIPDPEEPGIFYLGEREKDNVGNLSDVELYSMVLGRRTSATPSPHDMPLTRKLRLRVGAHFMAIGDAMKRRLPVAGWG